MNEITIQNVTKSYGSVLALDDVSLSFSENHIYGLLGRNGAGKSTLLNLITGRQFADSGNIRVDGQYAPENPEAQRKIFMMSEKNLYPTSMKVAEAFRWTSRFYPEFDRDLSASLSSRFGLDPKKKIKSLSTGYASIFKLITAVATRAPYIFLDEPVLGLDANHRDLFYRSLIEQYSENPRTYIISTHLIEEAANVIDQVIIIKNGRLLKDESRDDLLRQGYTISGPAASVDAYAAGRNILGSDTLGGLKTAYLLGECDASALPSGIEISHLDLQHLFIQLTNA